MPRHDPQKLQSEELPREAQQPSPPGSWALPVAEQSWSPCPHCPLGAFPGAWAPPTPPEKKQAPASSCGGLCQRPLWGKEKGAWGGLPTHCTQEPPGAHQATLLQAHGRPPPLPAPHPPGLLLLKAFTGPSSPPG